MYFHGFTMVVPVIVDAGGQHVALLALLNLRAHRLGIGPETFSLDMLT